MNLRGSICLLALLASSVAAEPGRDPFAPSLMERSELTKPPLASAETARPRRLEQLSVHELQWQGSLQRGEQQWLLLRGPDGHSYGVDARAPLGRERAQLLSLEADGLRLRAPGQPELRIPRYREPGS